MSKHCYNCPETVLTPSIGGYYKLHCKKLNKIVSEVYLSHDKYSEANLKALGMLFPDMLICPIYS